MSSDSISKTVLIMGGGVAGLSAAHELLKRGFQVTIVEKNFSNLGGKARSIVHTPENTELKLPAEHGFRFFPGFYGNITETMKEIKLENGKTVYDNLIPVKYYTFIFTDGRDPINIPLNIGFDIRRGQAERIRKELKIITKAFDEGILKIENKGRDHFMGKVIQLYTSCEDRFLTEYERVPWEEFIEAQNPEFGEDYRLVLAEGVTKNLVACRADKSSTRTGGKILAHILWQIISPFSDKADRILNAPTNEAWIFPWLKYLKSTYPEKLKIITGKRVIELNVKEKHYKGFKDAIVDVKIADTETSEGADQEVLKADFYISTLPIERLHSLLQRSKEVFRIDPTLGLLGKLSKEVEWMNGVIFYLNRELKITNGHVTIMDSDLAITIVSQTQYWPEYLSQNPLPVHNGIPIKSVLSAIVSNWDAKSKLHGSNLTLKQLTREQVKIEIWSQIKKCTILADDGTPTKLQDTDYFEDLTFLDEAIVPRRKNPERPESLCMHTDSIPDALENKLFNKEPLLVNTVVGHALRPDAHTRVDNLFLASDFVKTNSDLADMDTANEAARRAVNNILKKLKRSSDEFCKTDSYTLPSPLGLFGLARLKDERNFRKGLPWQKPAGLFFILKMAMKLGLKMSKSPKFLFYLLVILIIPLIPLAILINYIAVVVWKFINSLYAFR